MYQHITQLWEFFFESVLEYMSDIMSLFYRYSSLYHSVEIYVVLHSRFSYKTFLSSFDSRNSFCYLAYLFYQVIMCIFVEYFSKCRTENEIAVIEDKYRSKKSSHIIGILIPLSHNECDRYTYKSSKRGDSITSMMPSISFERRAVCLFTLF